jgi:hypothetical protein
VSGEGGGTTAQRPAAAVPVSGGGGAGPGKPGDRPAGRQRRATAPAWRSRLAQWLAQWLARWLAQRLGLGLLGALLVWLVITLVNRAVGGSFWLWGLPDPAPMLLYFLGPPAVLAAAAWLALRRAGLPRPDRALVSLAAAALGMAALHRLLTGRTWLWVLPDLVPPPLFLATPLALAAASAVLRLRGRLGRTAGRAVLLIALVALGLGADQAGLDYRALTGGARDGLAPVGALRVVSWDTFTWTRRRGPGPFYRFLHDQHADVYVLQGYPGPFRPLLPGDGADLRREFAGWQLAQVGDLVTVSRFPIVAQLPLLTNPQPPPGTGNIDFVGAWRYGALRTDLRVGDRVLSVYNAHFYDHFAFNVGPLTPAFYRNVRGLAAGRRAQFDQLRADIAANPHPVVVAGNLNTLPNNGDLRRLGPLVDAGRAGHTLYPATFRFVRLNLWKLDWIFVTPRVRVHEYTLHDPHRLSTRSLQSAVVSLPAG